MNYCAKCSKIIRSIKHCKNCRKQFCSETCLRHHIYTYHYNEQHKKQSNDKKIDNNNNLEVSYNFTSPYLTKGKMALGKVIYDKTYSLKNFIPYLENGKEKIIGTGSYGKVFLAINKIDKKYYAIKHMKKKDLFKALKTLKGIYAEIDIQSRINHPNIVKLLYVKENKDTFDLVMEYAKYGNLFFYIKRNSYLSEEKSFKYFIQIVNAIYFLHKNDLIHRDIKPENILMFENGVVKLCDFGWCTRLEGGQRITFCGTVEYMSPEMVNKEEYNKEIDIWSLGILLYEMIHGHSPFKPNKPKFNICDVISNIKIQNLKFNNDISEECKELIIHLLDRDINKRYKIEDIFNSKFVKFYENKNNFINNENEYINPDYNNKINYEKIDNNKINYEKIDNNININNDNYNNSQINVIKSNENIVIKKEIQKIKCKTKNNTARNFYPSHFEKNKEREIKEIKENNNNNPNHKYGSNCKVKNTQKIFNNNCEITARYISQTNLNNIYKKSNVKEKEQKNNNNAFSAVNLLNKNKNNEIKCQPSARIINSNENIIKNPANQSLTNRNRKNYNQTAKNRQISIDQKNNNNLIKKIIHETNDINNYNNNNNKNYTNREKTKSVKSRLVPGEIYNKKIVNLQLKDTFNNNYIVQNKVPIITDINENNFNINNINNNDNIRKPNNKVKTKILQTEENNKEEIKINFTNNQTGKRNTKVKNYYRINNKIENKTTNNNINDNNNYNYGVSSTPQINIINNNHIYNNNIVKFSTFMSNINNSNLNKQDLDKNITIRNIANNKLYQNSGIILLSNKDNKRQNIFPTKPQINKDNNCSHNDITIEDLDETPKKDIDNLKIMPHELLNNFAKELKGYLKKDEID